MVRKSRRKQMGAHGHEKHRLTDNTNRPVALLVSKAATSAALSELNSFLQVCASSDLLEAHTGLTTVV